MKPGIMAAKIAERINVPPGPIRRWALFLDIDGTLLDIAPTPHAVVVPETLLDVMDQLHASLDGALALISGRALADIDRLFRFHAEASPAAGQHGAELRLPDRRVIRAAVEPERLAALRARMTEETKTFPGTLIEHKGAGFAVHYRGAPDAGEAIGQVLGRLIGEVGGGFDLVPGKMVFEIKPKGADKGRAVEAFMERRPFAGRVPVFVGDDVTDHDGMAAAERLGGHAVHVGGEAGGRFWLPSPKFVRMWLAGLPRAAAREAARA